MKRVVSSAIVSVSALVAVAGLANSVKAIGVVPSMVYLYTGQDYGVGVGSAPGALAYNGGATPLWNWQPGSMATQPQIDANGRIYVYSQFRSSIGIAAMPVTQNLGGIYQATNHTNAAPFAMWESGQTDPNTGFKFTNNAGTAPGFNAFGNYLRTSGNMVSLGVQIGNPLGAGAGVQESGTAALAQNNNELYTGTFGAQSFVSRQGAVIALPTSNDWGIAPGGPTTNFNNSTVYRGMGQQFSDLNNSGTNLIVMTLPTVGPNPAVAPVTATTTVAATTGNANALTTIDATGNVTLIARQGDLPFGAGGPQFANGSNGTSAGNGVGGFFSKLNRNGQVAYDAQFLARGTLISGSTFTPGPGGVTTANDSTAWIYTPGAGTQASKNSQFYQEGNNVPVTATSAGTATWTGGIGTTPNGSFSNAGVLWSGTPTGGDTVTTGTNPNNQFLCISTTAGGLVPTTVIRKNDIAPGFTVASDVHLGSINNSSMRMNNNGYVAFGAGLQSANITNPTAVTSTVQFQYNQFGDGLITAVGVQGNDQAVFAGVPGGSLQMIARRGDAAPGFAGRFLNFDIGGLGMNHNNNGDIVFSSGLSAYSAGQTIGVVGQTPAASIIAENNTVLYSWTAAYGLVPLLYTGQLIEVDTGIFKYVSQYGASGVDNGDGGSWSLNDAGKLVVWVRTSDTNGGTATGTAYVVLQVPAPGAGALALLGLGAMARRRRRN